MLLHSAPGELIGVKVAELQLKPPNLTLLLLLLLYLTMEATHASGETVCKMAQVRDTIQAGRKVLYSTFGTHFTSHVPLVGSVSW